MYIGYYNDIYSDKSEYIFELNKRDYNKKYKACSKLSDEYFRALVDNKDLDSLVIVCDNIKQKYSRLSKIKSLPKVELLKLPLALGVKMKKPKFNPNNIKAYPAVIKRSDPKYNKKMPFMSKLFMGSIKRHYNNMQNLYLKDNKQWLLDLDEVQKFNETKKQEYENKLKDYETFLIDYENQRKEKEIALKLFNEKINSKEIKAIETLLLFLLGSVDLPLKDFNHKISCKIKDNTLRVEVDLPYVEDLMPIENVRYIKSRKELRFTEYSSTELNKHYHELIKKYVALISGLIQTNIQYFNFDAFVINGLIKARKLPVKVITISTRTSRNDMFNQEKFGSIDNWIEKTDGLVGKKLSNRTKLKEVY